jgi:hypothetical protein
MRIKNSLAAAGSLCLQKGFVEEREKNSKPPKKKRNVCEEEEAQPTLAQREKINYY